MVASISILLTPRYLYHPLQTYQGFMNSKNNYFKLFSFFFFQKLNLYKYIYIALQVKILKKLRYTVNIE